MADQIERIEVGADLHALNDMNIGTSNFGALCPSSQSRPGELCIAEQLHDDAFAPWSVKRRDFEAEPSRSKTDPEGILRFSILFQPLKLYYGRAFMRNVP